MPSVNVTSGVKEDRMMITGMHTVSDHRNAYMITGMHTHDYIVNLELTHWNKILFKAGTRCRALMEAITGLHQMLTWVWPMYCSLVGSMLVFDLIYLCQPYKFLS